MESIWKKGINAPEFDELRGDVKTDVLIIGGGMSGILCGYMLRRAGIDCVIAEARRICSGVTENTTAKITCHHGAIFDTMIRRYGEEKARLCLRAHQNAVEKYRELAQSIDCDFEEADSFVYSITDEEKIKKEVAALQRLGADARFIADTELPFPVAGAVELTGQAQFHPLKFAYAAAKDLNIYEHTEVTKIKGNVAFTQSGTITAQKIIVATHFPFINRHGLYFLKMYQHRSYVSVLENAPHLNGTYVDEAEDGMSFRSYGELLLLGGGSHRTGKTGGGWRELNEFASRCFPDAVEVCRYATQDCKTLDDIAYIGNYSASTPHLYAATGYNKWGMTSAMVAAQILTDLVRGVPNEYASLFSPSRSMLHKQLPINVGETLLGLLSPTVPRCSHLGCALHYNRREHSWDCACHGSRFTEHGRVINNPAMKDIKVDLYSDRN
ncbi:MAG: FAD-dependent oxidoreductase [Eubacteriales bacterium]